MQTHLICVHIQSKYLVELLLKVNFPIVGSIKSYLILIYKQIR